MKRIISLITAMIVAFSFVGATIVKKSDMTLQLSADNISYEVSSELYGMSLEDTGFACDGGLVSNLVNNNSFENADSDLTAWSVDTAEHEVLDEGGLNDNNKSYLSVTVDESGSLVNNGFTELYNYKTYDYNSRKASAPDMGFKAGEEYAFSAYFKNVDFDGTVTVSLHAGENDEKYQFDINDCQDWKKVSLTIKSDVTADGCLAISFEGSGTLYIDFVTLVPKNSYGYDSEGWKYVSLRTDLYDALKELSPKFIRFPGGRTTESDSLEELYSWKDTVGPLEQRRQSRSMWNSNASGYNYINTNFMGYHEYFTLCSDLGASPVPVVNAGVIYQKDSDYDKTAEEYANGAMTADKWQEYLDAVALRPGTDEWNEYVQDILDLIEYANGGTDTEWGANRAENGRTEPFNMKYIAIGSEGYGEVYWRNFDAIYNEIKAKYPDITVIAAAGDVTEDEDYNNMRSSLNSKYRDIIVDEHRYTDSIYRPMSTDLYNFYERSGAGVMVGEYSAKNNSIGTVWTKNNIWSAIENASYLTGLERNGDVVKMSAYAPAFAKVNAQSRDTALVWFDSQDTVMTPDYYVQMLFANNYGTHYVTADFDMRNNGIYHSVTVDKANEVLYVKLINSTRTNHTIDISLDGFSNVNNVTVQYMDETFKAACNELGEQLCVAPSQAELAVEENTVNYEIGSYSVSVIRIPYGKCDASLLFELPETDITQPYIHPAISVAIPCGLGAMVLITGIVILFVRIKHHKDVLKDQAEENKNKK